MRISSTPGACERARFWRAACDPRMRHGDDPTQPALLEQPGANDDAPSDSTPRISPQLFQLLETCACHRDPGRYALMYRVLWRSAHGERNLARRRARPRHRRARRDGPLGAARRPQDDRLRSLQADRRGGLRAALPRVARAGASYPAPNCAVFRQALRHDGLDDRHARRRGALGSRPSGLPPARVDAAPAAGREGIAVAHVLREHLQPCAPQRRRDADARWRRSTGPICPRRV